MKKGSKHTINTILKISNSRKGLVVGIDNNKWKGDMVGYVALHEWIYLHYGKANKCENKNCEYKNPKRYEWANISGKYLREISDWIQLCPSCHKKIDWKPSLFCRNGHKLENNVLIDNRGSRICKTCKKNNAHNDYLRHKQYIIDKVTKRRRENKLKIIRSTIHREETK